ncbi:MAG: hypothetical protein ACI9TI_001008 [Natronomonas sp.]
MIRIRAGLLLPHSHSAGDRSTSGASVWRLFVATETDAPANHLFSDSRSPSVYKWPTASEQPPTHAAIAGGALVVFAGAVFGWPRGSGGSIIATHSADCWTRGGELLKIVMQLLVWIAHPYRREAERLLVFESVKNAGGGDHRLFRDAAGVVDTDCVGVP